jgi:hypothetical protein
MEFFQKESFVGNKGRVMKQRNRRRKERSYNGDHEVPISLLSGPFSD